MSSLTAKQSIRSYIQQRIERWMSRRLKMSRKVKFNNKNLFIFPSAAGFGFLFVDVLLWLMGTNYENNMVLGLAFFMAALLIVSIHHTFFNLSGLEIEYVSSSPCFLGEMGEFEVLVSCSEKSEKENITLSCVDGNEACVDLIDEKQVRVKLFTKTTQRGWFHPGRLTVSSCYPLGIIRCWSHPSLAGEILVYPRPLSGFDIPLSGAGSDQEGNQLDKSGAEEFQGFKRHEVGMSPRHIAWKHYARGQQLLSKDFASYREQQLWLDWDSLPNLGKEQRLSVLCYWVLKLSNTQQPYGLRLPNVTIDPGMGIEHRQAVLKALALFP